MSSTRFNVGISNDDKISSRVLKPPGGGHTNIFAPPEEQVRQPRAKGNQQDSSMMGEIMGKKHDAEVARNNIISEAAPDNEPVNIPKSRIDNGVKDNVSNVAAADTARARVPPGGFSSGLW